jgi:DNA polymerase-3 subunit alpha
VRFGLNAIRGVSSAAITAIIDERRTNGLFTSIFDFCERVELRSVNKATIEALVKSGTFDSLHELALRAAVFSSITDAITAGQAAAEDRRNGQMNIFSAESAPVSADTVRPLPAVPPWERIKTLSFEKEALGFHVSGHPLDLFEEKLSQFATHNVKSARDQRDKCVVRLGGVLGQVRTRIVRNGRSAGQKMAIAAFADKTGVVDAVLFTDAYAKYASLIANDEVIAVVGRVDHARGEPNIIIDEVIPIDQLEHRVAQRLEVDLIDKPRSEPIREMMMRVDRTLRDAKANGGRSVDVLLRVLNGNQVIELRPSRLKVTPDDELVDRLRQIIGREHVRLVDHSTGGGGFSAP